MNRSSWWLALPWIMNIAPLVAAPAGGNILDQVDIRQEAGHGTVQVRFVHPFQYLDHFPQTQGHELYIRIRPIMASELEKQARVQREALSPAAGDALSLAEIRYEGDIAGRTYLVLEFDHAVNYEVFPGPDFRSISIVVFLDAPCTQP